MTNLSSTMRHPWILGTFAVYAPSLDLARQVYERVSSNEAHYEHFGTVSLESGEEIDWINIRSGVIRQQHAS
ncbi:hypothetical protein [Noviherbaspirillum sp.]|uniref:hypothetical protein n=1 Tax=Noviherbaspirillum sp. TaxID=1926288 RepID=UPI002FE0FEC2